MVMFSTLHCFLCAPKHFFSVLQLTDFVNKKEIAKRLIRKVSLTNGTALQAPITIENYSENFWWQFLPSALPVGVCKKANVVVKLRYEN